LIPLFWRTICSNFFPSTSFHFKPGRREAGPLGHRRVNCAHSSLGLSSREHKRSNASSSCDQWIRSVLACVQWSKPQESVFEPGPACQ
jgi:hypothetical protein